MAVSLFFTMVVARAQVHRPEPFAEAAKAIQSAEESPEEADSLKKVYVKRWTLGLFYGQRFIDAANQATVPDLITFADFRDQRSVYGVALGRYLTNRIQAQVSFDMLFLPKQQDLRTISFGGPNGVEVEGSGSGGGMLNVGLGGRYFLTSARDGRPYIGLKVGAIRAVAKGGEGGFSLGRGRFQSLRERTATYAYLHPTVGFTHRFTLGLGLNFHLGYMYTTQSDNIGRITSPGGTTATIGMELIMGARRNDN